MHSRGEALHSAQVTWEAVLQSSEDGREWGNQLFWVADALSESGALRRSLTDTSRTVDDRTALARTIFFGKVDSHVLDIVVYVVAQRWSRDDDFLNAFEALGVQTLLESASKGNRLSDVEEQLYRILRLLGRQRALRVALGDRAVPAEKREELARTVFVHLLPESLDLLIRAVHRAPDPTIAFALNQYIDAAGECGRHLIASVTVARELTPAQMARLTRILSERYGEAVAVHVTVRPSVVGGIRIHIGEDVIDGTLATRINNAKELMTK
ncbi:MAG: F0F1 ATP synthase subunit delta [Ancrocorticia sp.]|jgi:F-type H+-transporting ATPase subunit delta|nr:F0F1 ATP synthase subunit delta [Ancrocorticia sp.]MCI2192936.1 F0F1 ATP synthase subunit delta [Ancrocorticia sp.]MCI2199180.1 F0F1 ATP synthase subunit delta [Ancrocorticia sp.]